MALDSCSQHKKKRDPGTRLTSTTRQQRKINITTAVIWKPIEDQFYVIWSSEAYYQCHSITHEQNDNVTWQTSCTPLQPSHLGYSLFLFQVHQSSFAYPSLQFSCPELWTDKNANLKYNNNVTNFLKFPPYHPPFKKDAA